MATNRDPQQADDAAVHGLPALSNVGRSRSPPPSLTLLIWELEGVDYCR